MHDKKRKLLDKLKKVLDKIFRMQDKRCELHDKIILKLEMHNKKENC
jgi:hypothetical protein